MNGQKKYSFSAKEKLKSKKNIEELFKKGSSFYLNNFQVRFCAISQEVDNHQILISVPKKKLKRAVDRNLIKRRVREAYRLNKHIIVDFSKSQNFSIGFVYLSSSILSYKEIETQIIQCLKKLLNKIEQNHHGK